MGPWQSKDFVLLWNLKQINQHESFQELSKIIQKDFTKIIESQEGGLVIFYNVKTKTFNFKIYSTLPSQEFINFKFKKI